MFEVSRSYPKLPHDQALLHQRLPQHIDLRAVWPYVQTTVTRLQIA